MCRERVEKPWDKDYIWSLITYKYFWKCSASAVLGQISFVIYLPNNISSLSFISLLNALPLFCSIELNLYWHFLGGKNLSKLISLIIRVSEASYAHTSNRSSIPQPIWVSSQSASCLIYSMLYWRPSFCHSIKIQLVKEWLHPVSVWAISDCTVWFMVRSFIFGFIVYSSLYPWVVQFTAPIWEKLNIKCNQKSMVCEFFLFLCLLNRRVIQFFKYRK